MRHALRMLVLCAACSSAGANPRVDELQRDVRVITLEQMERSGALNMFEAVQRVHPDWLRARATGTTGQRKGLTLNSDTDVQVYIDSQHAGNTEVLKTMPIHGVVMARYYTASEAQTRFGSGNMNGVILLVTSFPTPSP